MPAPAGPVPVDEARAGLEILGSRYRVVYDEAVFTRTGFLAGDDDRRADELNRYLADPDIRAILPARGGYGTMRILPRLDADALRRDPKVVVGFSDLTALLSWCCLDALVRPVHGPTVTQLGKLPAADVESLFSLLEDPAPPGPIGGRLTRVGDHGGGTVAGRLVGGNLEIVTRLVGTPWALDLGAAVFLVEEVGERPYRIDRALTQLHLSGCFEGLRAVAAGDLVRCAEADGAPPSADQVLDERLATFQLPGVAGLPVGHGARNRALPIGAKCAVNLAEAGLVVEEGAVA